MSGVRYRYFSCIMILTILIMVFCPLKAWAKPNIQAKAAVLIDGNSGRILWEKNAFQPLPPASTLKIITAITALDLGNIQENCLVGANAAQTGESSIHLREGEQLTLRELLFGALLRSGNDACVAVGENIAGSEGLFVEWLNLKAASLSAFSASLKNTNGLPATNNLISAYDLSLCARYGMANPLFREIVASKNASIGKASSFRNLKNTNKLLWQRDDIVGIKTGTTNEAGNCLVTACRNQDDLLICVVFHSPDRYGESLAILDYGKAQFKSWNLEDKEDIAAYLPLKKGKQGFLPLQIAGKKNRGLYNKERKNFHLLWQLPDNIQLPVAKGQNIGKVIFQDDQGEVWGEFSLQAGKDISLTKPRWKIGFGKFEQ